MKRCIEFFNVVILTLLFAVGCSAATFNTGTDWTDTTKNLETTGTVTSSEFIGPLTGNVTGNVTATSISTSTLTVSSWGGFGGDADVLLQFETVADMKAATLTVGERYSTMGYTSIGDGGDATYLVVTSAAYGGSPDEYGDHTEGGGNVAVLQHNNIINGKQFGMVGDGSTDDAAAFQAALDYAEDYYLAVYLPAAGQRAGSLRSYYNLESTIYLHTGTTIRGDGSNRTELRWTDDTNGFDLTGRLTSAFTTNITVSGLMLRGNADVSSSASVTIGMRLSYINHSTFRDLWLQDWVDHIVIDAGNVGAAMTTFDRVQISSLKVPNETNGFPRYGVHLKGGTKKPQGIMWLDSCRIYAEEATVKTDHSPSGVDYDIDLGASELYRTEGLQIYVLGADGEWDLQVEGTDYDLYNMDSGSPVAIPTGDTYVGATEVRATFGGVPSNTVRMNWADPSGLTGFRIDEGTGNYVGGLIGGWDVNVYVNDSDNVVNNIYQQIASIGIQLTANGSNTYAHIRERTNATIYTNVVSRNLSAEQIDYGGGKGARGSYIEMTVDQQVVGVTQTQLVFGSDNYIQIDSTGPYVRVVNLNLDLQIESSDIRSAADVYLYRSLDNGTTWGVIGYRRVEIRAGGATSTYMRAPFYMKIYDNTILEAVAGNLSQPRYKAEIAGVTAGTTWTVFGTGNAASFLSAAEVNP